MTKYIYIGKGSFQPGIPARDITEEEFAALSGEQKARLIASGLYVAVEKPRVEVKEKHDKPRS